MRRQPTVAAWHCTRPAPAIIASTADMQRLRAAAGAPAAGPIECAAAPRNSCHGRRMRLSAATAVRWQGPARRPPARAAHRGRRVRLQHARRQRPPVGARHALQHRGGRARAAGRGQEEGRLGQHGVQHGERQQRRAGQRQQPPPAQPREHAPRQRGLGCAQGASGPAVPPSAESSVRISVACRVAEPLRAAFSAQNVVHARHQAQRGGHMAMQARRRRADTAPRRCCRPSRTPAARPAARRGAGWAQTPGTARTRRARRPGPGRPGRGTPAGTAQRARRG